MTALRHQIMDDGRVLVSLVGDRPQQTRVTTREAKRFAWALLSDLDPEGAFEAGYVEAETWVVATDRDRAPHGQQIQAIMRRLRAGDATTKEVAQLIQATTRHASVQLCKLRTRGLIECVQAGRSGRPAIWRWVGESA